MKAEEFETLLKTGSLYGFNQSTREMDIIKILGDYTETERYGEQSKFVHYDNLRFSINDGKMNGISLSFYKTNLNFRLTVEDKIFDINQNVSVLRMLELLNYFSLEWEIPYKNSKLDYLQINTSSMLNIFYYYDTESLVKINRIWI